MTSLRLVLPAPVRGRVQVLDELKGVAIILVVLYHAGGVLGWANTLHGDVGVDIFVILSAVGLTLGTSGEPAGRYLARRFLRVYPAYWIALTAFLILGTYLRYQQYDRLDVALHYIGIHSIFGDAHAMSINDSFWFITMIVVLYVAYLPLRGLDDRPDLLLFAGGIIMLIPAYFYLRAGQSVAFSYFSLRIPGFFCGLVAGRLMKLGQIEIRLNAALATALLIVFYVPYVVGFIIISPWVGAALMAGYAYICRPLAPGCVRAALRFMGDHSLEIFLIHQPLIREYNIYVLQRFFPGLGITPWSLIVGMAAGVALTIEISVWLHRLLKGLPSLVPREAPAHAA
jgi:peptidoglycan/LPS O-acetylase OafA/YrhL